MGRCCRGRQGSRSNSSNSSKFSRRKKKSRRPLYDLAMRRGLSSDCC
jgi:hypothetical protein